MEQTMTGAEPQPAEQGPPWSDKELQSLSDIWQEVKESRSALQRTQSLKELSHPLLLQQDSARSQDSNRGQWDSSGSSYSFGSRRLVVEAYVVVLFLVLWPLLVMRIHSTFNGVTQHKASGSSILDITSCPPGSGIPGYSKPSITAFIGVQTTFMEGSDGGHRSCHLAQARRAVLRETWFPASKLSMTQLYERYGFVVQFVIGRSKNAKAEGMLQREILEHGPMMRLDVSEDEEGSWARKIHSFFKTVLDNYDAQYVVKVNDDVYFSPNHLYHALPSYKKHSLEYIGCMGTADIEQDSASRLYEPNHRLLSKRQYSVFAQDNAFILSRRAARLLVSVSSGTYREFRHPGFQIGAAMLMFNITFFDDLRMCSPTCSPLIIAGYDSECAGMCNASSMHVWHSQKTCRSSFKKSFRGLHMVMPRLRLNNETAGRHA
mmetsp:Transcript_24926/g.69508  ORF Transcript_24926/g.69508 Transcript_24926/m.69508 type:complete len:433 (+) Transcript_24926:486-1784(+)